MTEAKLLTGLDQLASDGVSDLLRRVQDINNSYRAVAEKMGQLYMSADELKLTSLTKALDKPMRNASDNEQMFAAILEELQSSSSSTQ
jgi:hypothetical protein